MSNYDLLFRYQDERLLVDPKITFSNDFQRNITTFNDSTPIMRGIKDIAKDF